jgi:hypothetical protein
MLGDGADAVLFDLMVTNKINELRCPSPCLNSTTLGGYRLDLTKLFVFSTNGYEPRGRGFESCQPRQSKQGVTAR